MEGKEKKRMPSKVYGYVARTRYKRMPASVSILSLRTRYKRMPFQNYVYSRSGREYGLLSKSSQSWSRLKVKENPVG